MIPQKILESKGKYTLDLELVCKYQYNGKEFIERVQELNVSNNTVSSKDDYRIIEIFWSIYRRNIDTRIAQVVKDFYNYNEATKCLKLWNNYIKNQELLNKEPYTFRVVDTKLSNLTGYIEISTDRNMPLNMDDVSDCGKYIIKGMKLFPINKTGHIFICKFDQKSINNTSHIRVGDVFKTLYV